MVDKTKHTIVLDVMGADGGPESIIEGGISAARKAGDWLRIMLVGRRDTITDVLSGMSDVPGNISVGHAGTEVPMHVSATDGVRMRDSSISVGLRMVKEIKADAFVSPGNTGAVMATSLLTLGRIKGVSRPAITALFPTSTGRPTVVLDVGANADCKPIHLSQFAVMGSVYSSVMFDTEAPRVGLLSVGEERSKGNELIFSARKLLSESNINFVGHVEGRDILSGAVDVAVTDGFTGNILLKFGESIKPMLVKAVRRQIQTNIFSRFGVWLMLPFLKRMSKAFDYAESGGAPLLGVDGTVIVCHGASNARAIENGLLVALQMVTKRVKDRIREELITNHSGTSDEPKGKSQNSGNGIVCAARSDD
jgi:glycerol-3-phosphate acyltransferase PlsX